MGIGYVVGVLGGAILAHAAYATIQCTAPPLVVLRPEFALDLRFPPAAASDFARGSGMRFRGGFPVLRRPPRARIGPAVEVWVGCGRDRAVLKITEEEFTRPPMDVMMELLLGLALCMWAGLAVPAKFLSVLSHSEENRIVSLPANLDFMIFNHRGRALPSDPDLKLKK
ncbi:hypothetical protein C2845_PM06G31380 [Panicum miliaceum]|uniref:Membrane magnesium transporter n=1 Tax=Panicum miliaceum TaxID=4540 RepID=A0A3L6R982_PANMI|nr:hypothetical protein C2845_PM06G31380 [Panicum miliaceum]